jgi:hypothetical protein
MLITLPTGDVSAIITNNVCVQVNIHRVGIKPILTSKVQSYIYRGFDPVHALAACVSYTMHVTSRLAAKE